MNKASTILLAFVILLAIASVQNASAATWVEGHITVDTSWTVAGAPYIVINDVYVDEGVTLTIEPGVEVRFGGDFTIFVNGNLNAVGTSISEIVFTSNKISPAPGDWNTIELSGTASSSLYMEHCLIQYAKDGVTIDSLGRGEVISCEFTNNSESGVHIVGESNSLIKGNTIKLNDYGIFTHSDSASSGFSIINNEIANNAEKGLAIYSYYNISNITISGNTISSNGGVSVYVSTNFGYVYNIAISSNTINGYGGINLWGYYATNDITITNNTISSNGDSGIHVTSSRESYNITISGNTISSYEFREGVYIYADDIAYNITICDNTVVGSSKDGVGIEIIIPPTSFVTYGVHITSNIISSNYRGIYIHWSNGKAYIMGNSIANNHYGVYLDDSTGNAAHFNDIYQNEYGMYVTSDATVDAEQNYWGDPSGPYHESLNPWGKGNPVNGDGTDLDFIPFLTSSALITPPIANFTYSPEKTVVNETITFDASSSYDPDGYIVSYEWDFGDGNTGTGEVITHSYSSAGDYTVNLTVTDNDGAVNSTDKTITVYPSTSVFDTGASENPYPSIMGTHKGEIRPSANINVGKLYTYSCVGTGGHTESIELYENTTLIASGTWKGYQDDYHNITISPSVILLAGHTYNYTIVTGSYPQIIHATSKEVTGGTITCTSFVDANGKNYTDWIPAIRLE